MDHNHEKPRSMLRSYDEIKLAILLLLFSLILGCHGKTEQRHGIIALTPAQADAVWAFGVEDSHPIIGISPYATDKRAENIPKIANAGSVETIVSMHPELVLMHPSDEQLSQKLETMHIKTMMHGMDTFSQIHHAIRELGQYFHDEQKAEDIISHIQNIMQDNARQYARTNPAPILIVIDRLDMRLQQLYLAGSETYLADLVRGCGMEPIVYGKDLWVRIESEKLIELNPAHILFLARSPEDATEIETLFKQYYPMLNAVQNNHLYIYHNPDISVPGPSVVELQKTLCDLFNA